jgi:hypothetical protein
MAAPSRRRSVSAKSGIVQGGSGVLMDMFAVVGQ